MIVQFVTTFPRVGAVAITSESSLDLEPNLLGFCYGVRDETGVPVWSFIFENGCHYKFLMEQLQKFLRPVGICVALDQYQFKTVPKLLSDFDTGVFEPIFGYSPFWKGEVSILPDQIKEERK